MTRQELLDLSDKCQTNMGRVRAFCKALGFEARITEDNDKVLLEVVDAHGNYNCAFGVTDSGAAEKTLYWFDGFITGLNLVSMTSRSK